MNRYIDDFATRYQATLVYSDTSAEKPNTTILRVPLTNEARTILDHVVVPTQDGRDEVLDVLAYHLVQLEKKKMLNAQWIEFLGEFENLMLSQAMKLAEARFAEKVKKERKERDKIKKDGRRKIQQGAKQGAASDGAQNFTKGKQEAEKLLSRGKSTNLFDVLAEEDQ